MGRTLSGGMKLAAQQMMDNTKMSDIQYGTVVSTSPLQVKITETLTLPAASLVVPQNLTDYEVDVTVDWITDNKSGGSGDSAFSSHNHSITGTRKLKVHNALKIGDKVALVRKTGGQSYFILDRI